MAEAVEEAGVLGQGHGRRDATVPQMGAYPKRRRMRRVKFGVSNAAAGGDGNDLVTGTMGSDWRLV